MVDGELVALDKEGISSFPALQAALSGGRDQDLVFYLFDLLHLDGWDLRRCALRDRKDRLKGLDTWHGMLRYSDHHEGDAAAHAQGRMRDEAGRYHLQESRRAAIGRPQPRLAEGQVPAAARNCWSSAGPNPPAAAPGWARCIWATMIRQGALHYAGGVGTGFSDETLLMLRDRLNGLGTAPPRGLMVAGEDLERSIHWVKPELVAETSFTAWSGAGRVRHAVFLGLREDKAAKDVVRDPPDPDAERRSVTPKDYHRLRQEERTDHRRAPERVASQAAAAEPEPNAVKSGSVKSGPGKPEAGKSAAAPRTPRRTGSAIVTAKAPRARTETIEGVTLTHPDRALWPGITKRDLVEYWQTVADHALPGLAHRPLAIVRCPEGIDGEHFFQKHGHGAMPPGVRDGSADKAPFLAIDGLQGLVAMAQMSAIELHVWGSTEADPLHADQLGLRPRSGRGRDGAGNRRRGPGYARQAGGDRAGVVLPHQRRQGAACCRAAEA